MTILQQNGTMKKQEIQIKIDKKNCMCVFGLLPGQRLYRYGNGQLKIHWDHSFLQQAHERHYLANWNCLQLSALAGYLRFQESETEDILIIQDLQRRIGDIQDEINHRYNQVNNPDP